MRPATRLLVTLAFTLASTVAGSTAEAAPGSERAPPWRYPVALGIGGAGLATSAPGDGGGYGTAWLSFRWLPFLAPEIGLREGLARDRARLLTDLSIGTRFLVPLGAGALTVRVAFAHQHEIPWAAAREDLGGAVFGSSEDISHRSGIEVGLGAELPVEPHRPDSRARRLRPYAGANLLWFPDPSGPAVSMVCEAGLQVGLGPRPR